MPYFVIGGEYSDTSFTCLVEPAPVLGPFSSYKEAYDRWRARSFAAMDFAHVRYSIVHREDGEKPA